MISVLTWNLNGLDDRRLDERAEAACLAMLLRDAPDVVLLQEVVRRTLYAHLRPHFAAAGFVFVPAEPSTDSEYFCAAAVRGMTPRAAWTRPLPQTCMGRSLLAIEAEHQGQRWLFCTAHLESGRDLERERRVQVAAVLEWLAAHDGPAVFGGDTNLTGDVGSLPAQGVVDAWEAAGSPPSSRLTWRPDSGRGGARFDRIWLGGRGAWQIEAVDVTEPAPVSGARVSDHRPLRALVGWSP